MKYKIKYLPSVYQDMLRISRALEAYPAKAKRLFQELDKKLLGLENMPNMWPIFHARPKYRRMPLEDHLLFYTVDQKNREVKIYRMLYSKMDAAQHLEG